MATIFLNGTYDVIHIGHFNMLTYARQLAGPDGKVVVALDEDIKVMADKGLRRPIFDVHERAEALLSLKIGDKKIVDRIEFFETNLVLYHIIKRIKPDYIIKGSDWKGNVVGEDVAKVILFDRMTKYSTSEIIQRIRKKYT